MMTNLQKATIFAALSGMFLGWLLTAFVFYPPTPGWAVTEHWGDVATWVSGLATLFAVCVAIGVPWTQDRQRRAEQHQREFRIAQIAAIELADVMLDILKAIIDRRVVVGDASRGVYDATVAPFVAVATIYGENALPHGSDLVVLPYPLPPSIASLRTSLAIYNAALARVIGLSQTMSVADSVKHEKLGEALNRAQRALARAASHLAKYDSPASDIDFLDRGDGSKLMPLNDYFDKRTLEH